MARSCARLEAILHCKWPSLKPFALNSCDFFLKLYWPGAVVHVFNPGVWEVDGDWSLVSLRPACSSDFQDSQNTVRLSPKHK